MKVILPALIFLLSLTPATASAEHLFIISGQSNAAGVGRYIDSVFKPIVEGKYGAENVIVVHDAQSGMGIINWAPDGWLWTRLIDKLEPATDGREITQVIFIWMQGENDSGYPFQYEVKLRDLLHRAAGLFPQARTDYVIGRITDWSYGMPRPGWLMVRETQVGVCASTPRCRVVNTDDLNGSIQDIHYFGHYPVLAKRFAEAAIRIDDQVNKQKHFPLSLMVARSLGTAKGVIR